MSYVPHKPFAAVVIIKDSDGFIEHVRECYSYEEAHDYARRTTFEDFEYVGDVREVRIAVQYDPCTIAGLIERLRDSL